MTALRLLDEHECRVETDALERTGEKHQAIDAISQFLLQALSGKLHALNFSSRFATFLGSCNTSRQNCSSSKSRYAGPDAEDASAGAGTAARA
jgi:hypothetical protein